MTDGSETTSTQSDRIVQSTLFLLVYYLDTAAHIDFKLVRDTLDSLVKVNN